MSCSKIEVTVGYKFQLDDFIVYTLYSNDSKNKALDYEFKSTYRNGRYTVTEKIRKFFKTLTISAKKGKSGRLQ